MKKILVSVLASVMLVLSFGLAACEDEKRYDLTVNGSELLYESLNETYAEGEEVNVKVKIKPYEGVKVVLDNRKPLVKTKSSQDEYWQFTFEMPSHDATLDIKSHKGFDEPLLYGFYLTFSDKNGNSIEEFDKPVDSEEAIVDYAIIYYEDGHKVISSNMGANVLADSKSHVGTNSYEQEDTLYYTYEMLDATAFVNWVYIDEMTQEVYSYGTVGTTLNNIKGLSSLYKEQNWSDTRYNSRMEEYEEKFDSSVKVNFQYLDYLTGVKVLEFNAYNELIKSAHIEKSESGITHIVDEDCEYAVIEEEYTIKSGEHNGKKYIERTLINKTDGKFDGGKTLKYPRGDGLISPVYLSIK